MNVAVWAVIVTAYPFAIVLLVVWIDDATRFRDTEPVPLTPAPQPAVPRPTMKVEALGREVARFEILEHVAPDGEILEFHVPPAETKSDWTVDQVADALAAISRLPEPETL